MDKITVVKNLIEFINKSPTAFHAVSTVSEEFEKAGFNKLHPENKWELKPGGKYYLTYNNSALIGFIVGYENPVDYGYRLIVAHTDSPNFRVKPNSIIKEKGDYIKLNTEVYGGPILNTWLDRPLGLAGRVTLRLDNPFKPKKRLVDFNRPILIIPNLAIHLNKDVNKGVELNKQKELLPLLGISKDRLELKEILAQELAVPVEKILDFDLFLYEDQPGNIVGYNNQFISSSRLDDLAMVFSAYSSLIKTKVGRATNLVVFFDNEEVGSSTRQGADSPMLSSILERISLSLGLDRQDFFRSLNNSFMISADMAHALHPNYPEKHDPINKPLLNSGPVIKINANYRYTSDSDSISVYKEICRKAEVPYQEFVNRSDQHGGTTIGPISVTQLNIRSVDIGTPLLGMHSIRELGGVDDCCYVNKTFELFFRL